MGVRFDASRLEVSGAPLTLVGGRTGGHYLGSLAYVQQSRDAYNRLPVLVNRKGITQPLPGLAHWGQNTDESV
jgi:hypothetical protein